MAPQGFDPAPAPLTAGTVVGERWRVGDVLGEGATGIVYAAVDLRGGPEGALKVVHAPLASDPQIRGRVARELIALRKVSGAHVCPVLDAGEMAQGDGSTVPWVVLRRVHGPSLEDVLLERGPLPLGTALDLVDQVGRGLASAHLAGVVHRDLKPSNVVLDGGTHAVVVDFGLSRVLGGGTGTTGLTEHDMLVGTPEYMSPEQARGEEPDARGDVYALGVLAYELVTGCVPFAASSPFVVLTAQIEETPVAPRVRAPARGIDPAVEAVILRALAKRADDRWPSVDALRAALASARSAAAETWEDATPPSPGVVRGAVTTLVTGEAPLRGPRRSAAASAPATGEKEAAFGVGDGKTGHTLLSGSVAPPAAGREESTSRVKRPSGGVAALAPAPPVRARSTASIVVWVVIALLGLAAGVAFGLRR